MSLHEPIEPQWYAVRVTYCRELKLKAMLDRSGVENFVPMHYKWDRNAANPSKVLVPMVHNLIFVRTTPSGIRQLKELAEPIAPMRYIMDRQTNTPAVVPSDQMENFMKVCNTFDEGAICLADGNSALSKGDRVRITCGVLKGVEGVFCRIMGDRRVVVSIPNVISVATAFIHPSCLERI